MTRHTALTEYLPGLAVSLGHNSQFSGLSWAETVRLRNTHHLRGRETITNKSQLQFQSLDMIDRKGKHRVISEVEASKVMVKCLN